MGNPETPEEFVELALEEDGAAYGTALVAREVWDALDPNATELIFHIQDYGRFRLKLDRQRAECFTG